MISKAVVETVETQAHRIIIHGDGIIRVYSKPSHIELEDMKVLFSAYSEIRMNGDKLNVILDPTEENSMSAEARKYVVKHLKDNVQRIAVVGRKPFIRGLFKIFSSVINIGVEMNMFESEKKAERWITMETMNAEQVA